MADIKAKDAVNDNPVAPPVNPIDNNQTPPVDEGNTRPDLVGAKLVAVPARKLDEVPKGQKPRYQRAGHWYDPDGKDLGPVEEE